MHDFRVLDDPRGEVIFAILRRKTECLSLKELQAEGMHVKSGLRATC
jgi:hypothetical protein